MLTFQAVTDLLEHVLLMRKGLLELLDLLLLLVHLDGVVFNSVESLSPVVLILAVDWLQFLSHVVPRIGTQTSCSDFLSFFDLLLACLRLSSSPTWRFS